MQELSQEIIKDLLQYDTETGVFTWKERDLNWFATFGSFKSWNTRFANKVAGSIHVSKSGKKYFHITIFHCCYESHRLAFLYMTGKWPIEVDHEDGDGLNNKWSNLRNVSTQENHKNVRKRCTNTSGVCGVTWNKNANKWKAEIYFQGKEKYLGYFNSFEDAVYARHEAEVLYNYHPNHGQDRPL